MVSGEWRAWVWESGEGLGRARGVSGCRSKRARAAAVRQSQSGQMAEYPPPPTVDKETGLLSWRAARGLRLAGSPFSRPQAACAGGTRSRAHARLTRGTFSTRERSARRAGQRLRPAAATSSIGAERHVRPMQVRLMCAGRVHAGRQEGCVPCGKGDAPRRWEAARAPQGHTCARRLPLAPCDRSRWQQLGRPIRRDGRVAGRALYRRAAGSGRSR